MPKPSQTRRFRAPTKATSVPRASSQTNPAGTPRGAIFSLELGPKIDGAVVVTLTVAVAALMPSGVTELGEIVQVPRDSDGLAVHARETNWLNPLTGVTLRE